LACCALCGISDCSQQGIERPGWLYSKNYRFGVVPDFTESYGYRRNTGEQLIRTCDHLIDAGIRETVGGTGEHDCKV
jgi:hypothetical protein